MWLWIKTAIFSLLVPGVVAILIPQELAREASVSRWGLFPGLIVATFGVLTYLQCAAAFVSTGRGTPAPVDEPTKFVAVGPYRFSRNPMYVGVLATILGQAMIYASWEISVYALLFFAAVELFVLFYEEPHLRRKFGAEYDEYCRQTPRWIGLNRSK